MNKKEKKKKLLLVFLLVVMGLILFSSYINTTEIDLGSLFGQKKISKQKELFFESDRETKKEKEEQIENINKKKNNSSTNLEENNKIKSITLIKEIKDPFKNAQNINDLAEVKDENKIGDKINGAGEIIFLEKNITAESLISQTQGSKKMTKSEKKGQKELALSVSKSKENIKTINRQSLKNIQLPFRLIGIIKNSTNSSALFLYQGQTLLKNEKENIDVFTIEQINNKNLIISYQNEERIIHLWKEKYNEN